MPSGFNIKCCRISVVKHSGYRTFDVSALSIINIIIIKLTISREKCVKLKAMRGDTVDPTVNIYCIQHMLFLHYCLFNWTSSRNAIFISFIKYVLSGS